MHNESIINKLAYRNEEREGAGGETSMIFSEEVSLLWYISQPDCYKATDQAYTTHVFFLGEAWGLSFSLVIAL